MKARGWYSAPNNETGAGYGVRISPSDRDRYFRRTWARVILFIEGQGKVSANLTPSFWRGCVELRSQKIGKWMLGLGLAPWPQGQPPVFELEPIGDATFRLRTTYRSLGDDPAINERIRDCSA